MSNLTVNDNKEIVYKEVELTKPLGRAVENITHTPEACNEHFTRKFNEIINEIQQYLHLRFKDSEEEPLKLFDFDFIFFRVFVSIWQLCCNSVLL